MYSQQQHDHQDGFGTFVVHGNSNPSSHGGRGRGGYRGGGGGGAASFQPAEFSALRTLSGSGGGGANVPNPSAYNQQQQWSMPTHQSPQPQGRRGGANLAQASPQQQQQQQMMSSMNPMTSTGDPDVYEIHDNQLKAPVAIRKCDVMFTQGSLRLFSLPPQQLNAALVGGQNGAQRNAPRICEAFQQQQCLQGEECQDVHVATEVLQNIRNQMLNWLLSKEAEFSDAAMHAPETTFRVFAADLKEVVDVPINALSFTRGLYVDPSARAKRSRYGQQSAFALMAAQVPTACGLHSVDPAQCKWGRWCNQAHIDPYWMRMKRGEFENWSRSLEQQFEDMPDEHVFVVHDPQTKSSLQIQKAAVAGFSRGLFQGNAKKAPSVCMLFQRGRCTANSCCNQIHVFPEYLALLRQYMADGNPDLVYAMQQVAHQQKQLMQQHLHQQMAALNLNPDARPFVPPGTEPPASYASTGHGYTQQQQMYASQQHQQQQQQDHDFQAPQRIEPMHSLPPPVGTFATVMDVRQRTSPLQIPSSQTNRTPLSSPMIQPSSPATMAVKVGSGPSLLSPPFKAGISPLADLRCEEDEVFERRRQAAAATPTTPVKQNNPYNINVQKPIGVPPSPLHTVALPPPVHVPQQPLHQSVSQSERNAPPQGTPPLQFGWVPQARLPPPANSLPMPPSPYRSAALRTPTSPQYPAPFTPDLSHMQFSPSPLLRAESITNMPKNMSLEGFEELQPGSSAIMLPPGAMSNSMHSSLTGHVRQGQPYQMPSQHNSGNSSSTPSRVGNGTPVEQRQ